MMLKQYLLRSVDETGGIREIVCWLEDGRAKTGDVITLKTSEDPDRKWSIIAGYARVNSDQINRGWENNI